MMLLVLVVGCGGPAASSPPPAPRGASADSAAAPSPSPGPSPSLVPDANASGGVMPGCNAALRAEPWPTAGQPPPGRGIFADWIGHHYVHLEDDRENATWRAHIYSPADERWKTAEFSTVDARLRARLHPGELDRFHASLAPIFVSATASRLVAAPLDDGPRAHGGAILDPATATWRALSSEHAVWRRSHSRMWSAGRHVLFWPFPATPHSKAGTEIWLLDPERPKTVSVPFPPIDMNRQSPLVALDDRYIVVYGGEQRDQYNNAAKSFGDGAVFDIEAGRWTRMPPGSPGRIASPARFHDGVLLLFGGIDYSLSKQPEVAGDALVVRDIRALDVKSNRWLQPAPAWSSWQRWQPGFDGCTGCGPTVAVGSRIFVGRRAVFDTATKKLRVAPPFPAPATWGRPEGNGQENLRGVAIDDRHVLLTSTSSDEATREAILFDAVSLRQCVLAIPASASPLLVGTHQSFHDDALYLWRAGRTVTEVEDRDCPPGAPCAAPRQFERYVGPEAAVLRLQR